MDKTYGWGWLAARGFTITRLAGRLTEQSARHICRAGSLDGERNAEAGPREMGTFPYLAEEEKCDGCRECVRQCPVGAMVVMGGNEATV